MSTRTTVEAILLDIEGTTSSVSFVYEVLFPYARQRVRNYLEHNLQNESVWKAVNLMATDLSFRNAEEWLQYGDFEEPVERIEKQVYKWMDADAKLTGLKELQGLIWNEGYSKGELKSQVFADVPECMRVWKSDGIEISIYSSGSIGAQKAFFKDTEYGDLTVYLNYYFDTTSGPKKEEQSYRVIAGGIGMKPEQILFISDVTDELKAAAETGMQTALAIRPGNKPQTDAESFSRIETFNQVKDRFDLLVQ